MAYKKINRLQYQDFKEIETISDWFKVYELPNDIIAIYEPCHMQESIAYLIRGEDTCLLWDTGLGMFDIKSIIDSLLDKDLLVVNSHYHFDHVGGNFQFEKVHVYNHEIMLNRVKHGVANPQGDENFTKEAIDYQGKNSFNIEEYSVLPTKNFMVIEDGHIFNLGNRKLRVEHVPLHSPDSIMLISDDEKIIFTGDTVHPINTSVHLGFAKFEDHADSFIDTVKKLAEKYQDYRLYCSHAEPILSGIRFAEIANALQEIKEGRGDYQVDNDGFRKFQFDNFAITVD